MGRSNDAVAAGLVAAASLIAACAPSEPDPLAEFDPGPTPASYAPGEALYRAKCLSCHGPDGRGSPQGPPLVHVIYQPNHHGDSAFLLAVQRGVVAHHWDFGNMAPVPGVTTEQVGEIVNYVRWLQRQAGIF